MAPAVEPPVVPDLIACPELAALHVLEVVLDAAITALEAAHADVFWDEDLQFEGWPNYDAIRAAKEIFTDARKLRSALRRYRPDRTPPWVAHQLALDLDPGEDVPF
jgi:hypothetical protein